MRGLKMRFRGVCVWERNAFFESAIDNFLVCLWSADRNGKDISCRSPKRITSLQSGWHCTDEPIANQDQWLRSADSGLKPVYAYI